MPPRRRQSPPERRAHMGGRRKMRNRRWREVVVRRLGKGMERNKGGEYIYIYFRGKLQLMTLMFILNYISNP